MIALTGRASEPLDIAVIGAGIAGMSAAWLLSERHRVTVFEQEPLPGGHSNTIVAATAHGPVPVDTGFIVYNELNYPNLKALFRHLDVATQPSDMSFAVSLDDGDIEYAGTDLGGLFAQKRNLLRPRFWRMLRGIQKFYGTAPAALHRLDPDVSLGDYLDAEGFDAAFIDDHLLPMAAAIWSAPMATMRQHPARAFIRFCENHGLLKVSDRPPWRTVTGGSREYIKHLTARYADRIRTSTGVREVSRDQGGAWVRAEGQEPQRFDQIVMACHGDQALRLLQDPTAAETNILGRIRYGANTAILHSDETLMPVRRRVWSSWNYLGYRDRADQQLAVTYWMNKLQSLPEHTPLFVTLNPARPPRAGTVISTHHYEHPIFDAAALHAQSALADIQGQNRAWFCGAWTGAGFHEDGLRSGLEVAEAISGLRRPWADDAPAMQESVAA